MCRPSTKLFNERVRFYLYLQKVSSSFIVIITQKRNKMKTKNTVIIMVFYIIGMLFASCEKNGDKNTYAQEQSTKAEIYSFEITDPIHNHSSYQQLLNHEESLWRWRVVESGEFLFDIDIVMEDTESEYELTDNGDGTYLIIFKDDPSCHLIISSVTSLNGTTVFNITTHQGENYRMQINMPVEYDVLNLLMMNSANTPLSMKEAGPIKDFIKRVYRAISELAKAFVDCARVVEEAKRRCENAGCIARKEGNTLLCGSLPNDADKQAQCASLTTHC